MAEEERRGFRYLTLPGVRGVAGELKQTFQNNVADKVALLIAVSEYSRRAPSKCGLLTLATPISSG